MSREPFSNDKWMTGDGKAQYSANSIHILLTCGHRISSRAMLKACWNHRYLVLHLHPSTRTAPLVVRPGNMTDGSYTGQGAAARRSSTENRRFPPYTKSLLILTHYCGRPDVRHTNTSHECGTLRVLRPRILILSISFGVIKRFPHPLDSLSYS